MELLPRSALSKRKARKKKRTFIKVILVLISFILLVSVGFVAQYLLSRPRLVPIGTIEMKSVSIKLNIFDGVSEEALIKGIGRLENSQEIGQQGNTVLSGYGLQPGRYFYNLDKIQLGDEIIVTPAWTRQSLVYVVTEIKTVSAEAADELISDPLEFRITLITTSKEDSNLRFLVKAKQKDQTTSGEISLKGVS